MLKKVIVTVPGSTANIGAGFDCLGIALSIYNRFEFEIIDKVVERHPCPLLELEGEGSDYLPVDKNNIVVKSAEKIFKLCSEKMPPLRIKINSNIPLARGLGSSATAIIGAMVSANYLCGNRFDEQELLNEIVETEGHPDNTVASYFGGLTATCVVESKILHIKYNIHKDIKLILCIPEFKLSTEEARRAIPQLIPHKDAIFNLARVPFIINSLVIGNLEDLHSAVEDKLHQNYREKLLPHFRDVVSSAYKAGAKGVALSGAGPSILAITKENAEKISSAMVNTFKKYNISSKGLVIPPDNKGIRVETKM